jgi:hypothetical protein
MAPLIPTLADLQHWITFLAMLGAAVVGAGIIFRILAAAETLWHHENR